MKTRITELLGIEHPILQAGMSWASSHSALPLAVSNAGGLGVVAAGPMRVEDLRRTLAEMQGGTTRPWAVNIPLYNPRSAEFIDIALEARAPVVIASQGGPAEHLPRFRSIGTKWLHVVTTEAHARKAEAAGVDGLVVVGMEAGGHPAPSEVTTLVLVRSIVRNVKVPVVAGGGVADGAGIAALLALGAEAVQLGTRFLASSEANVHEAYKRAVVEAAIDATTLVARGRLPIRQLRNAFSARYEAAERSGTPAAELQELFKGASLKQSALEGDIADGKPEAGQSAGLVDEVLPAAEIMRRLVDELRVALERLCHGGNGQ